MPSIPYSRRLMTESMGHCTPITEGSPGATKRKESFPNLEVGLYTQRTQRKLEGELDPGWFLLPLFPPFPSESKQAYVKNLDQTMTRLYKNSQIDDDANNNVVSKKPPSSKTDKKNSIGSLYVNGAPAPMFAVIESRLLITRKTQTATESSWRLRTIHAFPIAPSNSLVRSKTMPSLLPNPSFNFTIGSSSRIRNPNTTSNIKKIHNTVSHSPYKYAFLMNIMWRFCSSINLWSQEKPVAR